MNWENILSPTGIFWVLNLIYFVAMAFDLLGAPSMKEVGAGLATT
jgi:hypothetical protein